MKKRYVELDILRGLAIVGVLLIHITARLVSAESGAALFLNQASRFAVPTFIFLSGLGLTLGNKLDQGYWKFLKNQISKIIFLYIVWSFVYYVAGADTLHIGEFVQGLFYGTNHYHLYYVPLIITLYILYPLLLKLGKSNIGLTVTLMITAVSQVIDLNTEFFIFNEELNIFNWIFYFVLGVWLAQNFDQKMNYLKEHSTQITTLFFLTLVGTYIESYFLMDSFTVGLSTSSTRPTVIIFSVLFIMMILSLENFAFQPTLSLLSKHSYGIYLSHVLILEFYVDFITEAGFPSGGFIYIVLSFVIITMLSILATKLSNKFNTAFDELVNYRKVQY